MPREAGGGAVRKGRTPASNTVKLAKGERRPSRLNPDEQPAIPPPSNLDPPAGLTGAGLHEWKRLAVALTEAGTLRVSDLVALEDYCRALSQLRRFEDESRKAGAELAIAKGFQGMVVKLRAQVNMLRRELGLTPTSRASVRVPPPKKDPPKDARILDYLRGLPGGRGPTDGR
jgi:P27 family predicted phage terminase small subunit